MRYLVTATDEQGRSYFAEEVERKGPISAVAAHEIYRGPSRPTRSPLRATGELLDVGPPPGETTWKLVEFPPGQEYPALLEHHRLLDGGRGQRPVQRGPGRADAGTRRLRAGHRDKSPLVHRDGLSAPGRHARRRRPRGTHPAAVTPRPWHAPWHTERASTPPAPRAASRTSARGEVHIGCCRRHRGPAGSCHCPARVAVGHSS